MLLKHSLSYYHPLVSSLVKAFWKVGPSVWECGMTEFFLFLFFILFFWGKRYFISKKWSFTCISLCLKEIIMIQWDLWQLLKGWCSWSGVLQALFTAEATVDMALLSLQDQSVQETREADWQWLIWGGLILLFHFAFVGQNSGCHIGSLYKCNRTHS